MSFVSGKEGDVTSTKGNPFGLDKDPVGAGSVQVRLSRLCLYELSWIYNLKCFHLLYLFLNHWQSEHGMGDDQHTA